jgi:hypothetical protein
VELREECLFVKEVVVEGRECKVKGDDRDDMREDELDDEVERKGSSK